LSHRVTGSKTRHSALDAESPQTGDCGSSPPLEDFIPLLFQDGLHLITGIKNNMKNRLMTMRDKILLRKQSVIETINDELKNICEIEHSRHRRPVNFLINLFAGMPAYSFFEKKPAIKFDRSQPNGQLELFY
jgi:hypothetical protein